MTKKTNLEILSNALAQAINGEPAPSFRSEDFAEILAAAGHLTQGDFQNADMARLGLEAVKLIGARLVAGMHSERAMAMMRDN